MNRRWNLATSVVLAALVAAGCSTDPNDTGTDDTTDSLNNAAPTVELQAPADGAVYQFGEAVEIIARVNDDRDRVETLDVAIYSNVGGDGAPVVLDRPEADTNGFVSFVTSTLDVGNHTLTVTARDGGSKIGEATVDIMVNGAPVIPGLTIEPATPTSADTLTAVIDDQLIDVNRATDQLGLTWQWFRDDQDASIMTAIVDPAETVRGETWKVVLTVTDPLGSESVAEASVTIANARPVCVEAVLAPDKGGTEQDFTCMCETRRDADPDDPIEDTCEFFDGDTQILVEGCTLSSEETHKGMQLSCHLTPNDGTARGPTAVSETLVVANTPPPQATAIITPTNGTIREPFTCSIDEVPTDPDGDQVFIEYLWVVNGNENPGTSSTTVIPFDQLMDQNATAVSRGDQVWCRVRTYDGDDRSAYSDSEHVVLENASPLGGIVTVGPLPPSEADTLICSASGALDPDGDEVYWLYAWEVNGEILADADELSLTPERTNIGDQVRCIATPTDGADPGEPVTSKNLVVIENIAPTKPEVALSAPFGADGPVTCQLVIAPTDNGPFTSTYLWQINGGDEFEGPASLDADQVDNCNIIRCRLRVDDGATIIDSNTVELTLPIGDCPDENPCTVSACLPSGVCATQPQTGACDDGDACTSGDTCVDGACTGDPKSCDDGQFCTQDSCDPASGVCLNMLTDDMCADGNGCTDDRCSPSANDGAGGCVFDTLDDVPCDRDGNGCTAGDRCLDGECIAGARADCDAGQEPEACFVRRCVSTGADTYTCEVDPYDDGVTCDDGAWCTLGDHCDGAGACVGGTDRNCQQGLGTCQIGSCNEASDRCDIESIPDDTPCNNDSNGCTVGDACGGGVCRRGAEADCSALDGACVRGLCSSLGAESYECVEASRPAGLPCPSDEFCTVNTTCDGAGACTGGEDRDCDAELGDQCVTAYCDVSLESCVPEFVDAGTPCDDGDPCTQPDSCSFGACTSSVSICLEEQLSYTTPPAKRPLVRHLGDGRYVTQWYGIGDNNIRMRVSNLQGSREAEQVLPGGTALGTQSLSSFHEIKDVAVDDGGRFMVLTSTGTTSCAPSSWCGSAGDRRLELTTQGVVYDTLLNVAGSGALVEMQVYKPTYDFALSAGAQLQPLSYSDGSWGVLHGTIATQGTNYDATPSRGVYYYPIGASLVPTPPVRLIDTGDTNFELFHASLVPESDDFILAWVSPDGASILAERYDRFGNQSPGDPEVVVSADAGHTISEVRVHAYRDSGYALLWSEGPPSGDQLVKAYRHFPAYLGVPDYPIVLDAAPNGSSTVGGMDAFDDGGLVVTWSNTAADADGSGVLARVFDSQGTPETDAFVVHVDQSGTQRLPNVATLGGPNYVVAFVGANGMLYTRLFNRPSQVAPGRAEAEVSQIPQLAQSEPDGAADAAGHVLVAWQSASLGATVSDVYARQYDADGQPMMAQALVNSTTPGAQTNPSVAGGDDWFAVAWDSDGQDGDGLGAYLRVVPNDGSGMTAELQLDTVTAGDQHSVALAAADSGDRVAAAWVSEGSVRLRIVGSAGAALSAPSEVHASAGGAAASASVAPVSDGYVIGWVHQNLAGESVVALRKLDVAGAAVTGEVEHAVTTGAVSSVRLAASGGSVLACWRATVSPTVACRLIDPSSLAAVGSVMTLSSSTSASDVDVAGLAMDGAFTVAWATNGVDGDQAAVQYQRIQGGAVASPRIVANRYRALSQRAPFAAAISSSASDAIVVGWQSQDQDGEDWGVYLRALDFTSYGVQP